MLNKVKGYGPEIDLEKPAAEVGLYLERAGKNTVLGEFSGEFNELGLFGNMILGLTPFDAAFDIRDAAYSISQFQKRSIWENLFAIITSAIGFIPLGDVVKYPRYLNLKKVDEVAKIVEDSSGEVIEEITENAVRQVEEVGGAIEDGVGSGADVVESGGGHKGSGKYLGKGGNPSLSIRSSTIKQELIERFGKRNIKGNIAVAEINIPNVSKELKAYSGTKIQPDGFVQLKENRIFDTKSIDGKGIIDSAGAWDRAVDTEAKILEQIASEIGEDVTKKGTVKLHTILEPCESCKDVITQFSQKYSNIEVDISWD